MSLTPKLGQSVEKDYLLGQEIQKNFVGEGGLLTGTVTEAKDERGERFVVTWEGRKGRKSTSTMSREVVKQHLTSTRCCSAEAPGAKRQKADASGGWSAVVPPDIVPGKDGRLDPQLIYTHRLLENPLPMHTPAEHWDEHCFTCERRGIPPAEGVDVLTCSFCKNSFRNRKECLKGCFPVKSFELTWDEQEGEWACPMCYFKAEKTLADMVYGEESIKRILSKGNIERKSKDQFLFCIISKGRPDNVAAMMDVFAADGDVDPTWIVGKGEAGDYRAGGAVNVVEGGGLCASRNMAIDLAAKAGKTCVQLSDDLLHMMVSICDNDFQWWEKYGADPFSAARPKPSQDESNKYARAGRECKVTPVGAARFMEAMMRWQGAKLAGVYPNCNQGFAYNMPPTAPTHFIIGDFIVVEPTDLRFDEEMSLKEDYDFTAQHIAAHGKVCRLNRLFVKAVHYVNEGGAVAVRNTAREQFNIKVLRRKWPGVFVDQRRKNEVVMRWEYHKPDDSEDEDY